MFFQLLVNYCFSASDRAHPVTRSNLIQAVEAILSKEKKPRTIYVRASTHKTWFIGFKTRHPTLVFRTPESLTQARLAKVYTSTSYICDLLYL